MKKFISAVILSFICLTITCFSLAAKEINIVSEKVLLKRANQAAKVRNYKAAVQLFADLVNENRSNVSYRAKYAYVLFLNKDYELATDQFKTLLILTDDQKIKKFARKKLVEIYKIKKLQAAKAAKSEEVNNENNQPENLPNQENR